MLQGLCIGRLLPLFREFSSPILSEGLTHFLRTVYTYHLHKAFPGNHREKYPFLHHSLYTYPALFLLMVIYHYLEFILYFFGDLFIVCL